MDSLPPAATDSQPPTPYYSDGRATLYRADALAILRELPTASVDALITDPPYSSGGMVRGDRATSTTTKYVLSHSRNAAPDFTGDNRDQRSFLAWMNLWLHEAQRVLRPGSPVVLFSDWRQLPTMTDALQIGGYVWRGIVPWYKPPGTTRPNKGRFAASCEYAIWGSLGPMSAARDVGVLDGFYEAAPPRPREHITQKPLTVMRSLVQIAPPAATILDPFVGSGTTGVAALIEGRQFIGVELSEHFAEVAAERLRITEHGPRDDGMQAVFEFGEETA